MKYRHYSPRAKIILVTGKDAGEKVKRLSEQYRRAGKKVFAINESSKERLAKTLFSKFREADINNMDMIIVKGVEETGTGLAIMSRLKKSATKIVKT